MTITKKITVAAGLCAAETYEPTMEMAYKIKAFRDIAQPFNIDFMYRSGAWKPRTEYWARNGEKVFEGAREEGLKWLSEVAETYDLSIVTECMSEDDLRHFGRELERERDYIQIGARNSQNFALLYAVGGTSFNVLLKNPQHGINPKEAAGSLQRLEKNRDRVYCVRGQHKFIPPDGIEDEAYRRFMEELLRSETQHPDARNLNNIGAIRLLRQNPYLTANHINFGYDPSHTFGGKNDEVRRMLGEYAIKAITEYGYDWLEIEVNDKASYAIVDGDQALLTTTRNVDWSQTNAGQGPGVKPNAGREPNVMPLTLVDITSALIDHQAELMGIDAEQITSAKKKLQEISWDMTP